MKNVQRYFRVDSAIVSGAVTDADGFMYDSPIVARTGIYTYVNPDKTIRREYRPREEVFDNESMLSFKGKPIVVEHPKTGKITSKTAKGLSIGAILSNGYVRQCDGGVDYVGCDIVIHDPAAIGDLRELSLGYRCDVEETPGVTATGEHYDAIQRNIRINHLAVVKKARAGMKARLNCDGDECISLEDEVKEIKMSKFKIDGMEHDLPDTVISHIEALQTRADAAENNVLAMKTVLQGKEDELKAQVDGATELASHCDELEDEIEALTQENDDMTKRLDAAVAEKEEAVAKLDECAKRADKAKADYETIKAQCDELTKKCDEAAQKYDACKKDYDAMQAKFDAAKEENAKAVAAAKEQAKAEMAERGELEGLAKKANVTVEDGMDNKMLKLAIIKALRDGFDEKDKSEDYIEGAFDYAKEKLRGDSMGEQMKQALGVQQNQQRQDGDDSAMSAREKMIARQKEAYKAQDAKF